MKIFIYTALEPVYQLELCELAPTGSELIFKSDLSEAEQQEVFNSADIIMGNPPPVWFERHPSRLLFWQLDSAGFDEYQHITLEIPVANMSDFFARECAETIVGGVLAFYRGLHQLIRLQPEKKWEGKRIRPSLDVLGTKRVLVLGAGGIGSCVKKILEGFGCRVKTTARKNPSADFHSLDEVLNALKETDVVINALPGTAEYYVSKLFFDEMTDGSVYASIGRGKTTDEEALIAVLRSGKLAGAVLDVNEIEPLPVENQLWEMENVILTQHTGGGHACEQKGRVEKFISNLNRFLTKQNVKDQINLTQGY